jgi:hypothetical protein
LKLTSPNNFSTEIESAVQQLTERIGQNDTMRAVEGVWVMASHMSTIAQYKTFRNGLMTSLKLLITIASRDRDDCLTIFEALQQQGGGLWDTAIALAANVDAWDRYIEVEQSIVNLQTRNQPLNTLAARIRSVFSRKAAASGEVDGI